MFEKFFKDENCMKILCWILSHSPGDYDAAIISYDSGVVSPQDFITVIVILNELGIVIVDESQEENLRIIINDDSPLYQKLKSLRDEFDEKIYASSDACAAILALDTFSMAKDMFSSENLREAADTMLSEVETYENLSDDEAIPDKFIRYKVLDDEGNLDEFKDFLKKFE